MKYIQIKTLEISGFLSCLESLRLPYGLECRSYTGGYYTADMAANTISHQYWCNIDNKDIALMSALIQRGDEHAKALRLINVYANITAPRYFWQEMVTYEVGVTKGCSNSTLHQECKGMTTDELVKFKEQLPEGTMQTRTYMFSYQALRRIYRQRENHKLPHWHELCEWIENLPFSEQLITIGLK